MKQVLLAILLTSLLYSSDVSNEFKCMDGKLFIQTVVYERTQYGNHIVSASLTQVFSQWGSALAVTDCKTHEVRMK